MEWRGVEWSRVGGVEWRGVGVGWVEWCGEGLE